MELNTLVFAPQVTVHYEQKDGAVIPKRVHTIVISVQHDDYISLEEQKKVLKDKVRSHQNTGSSQIIMSYPWVQCWISCVRWSMQLSPLNIWMTRLFTTSSRVAALLSEDPRWALTHMLLIQSKQRIHNCAPLAFSYQTGWRWSYRQENHRRHVRRLGSSRRWSFLRQRLLKGGSLRRLCCPLGGQISGQGQTVQESSGAGEGAAEGAAMCTSDQIQPYPKDTAAWR